MNKDFDVKSFIEEYEKQSTNDDKIKFLKTKLKSDKYMSYAEKILVAENIVKSSSYGMVKEGDELKQVNKIVFNSPMRYILFVMTVVDKYTNIDVDFKNIIFDFDYLNSNDLIEVIFEKVGDKEISEFNTVVEMVLNDFMANKYQFKNYIGDTLLKISEIAEKCAPLVENVKNKIDGISETDIENLFNLIAKTTKLIK